MINICLWPWKEPKQDLSRWFQSIIVVVQSLSRVRVSVTPWTTTRQASLFLTISQSLPKFMSVELVMSVESSQYQIH